MLARDRVCCLSEGTKICPYGAYFALECMLLRLHLQAMMISTQTMQKHQRRISAHATRIPIALLWAQRAGQVLPLRLLTTRRSSLASPVMLLIMQESPLGCVLMVPAVAPATALFLALSRECTWRGMITAAATRKAQIAMWN